MVFKALIDALTGKIEDPQVMLESAYAELQLVIVSGRQKIARLVAMETQLKRQIEALEKVEAEIEEAVAAGESSDSELSELKLQLQNVQAEIAELRRILSELEDDAGRAYMRTQAVIARDKASNAILVGKAITEDGTTFDTEIASTRVELQRKYVPKWLLVFFAVALVAFIGAVVNCCINGIF